jgi:predicted CXXCH cytochrome family protein
MFVATFSPERALIQLLEKEKSMKKILAIVVLVLAWTFVSVLVVSADNGPHGGGGFDPTADACAGCHRAHTADQASLLAGSAELCSSCHDSAGSGADTNVWDGVYLERDGNAESPTEGVASRGLKGGGVINAVMNTDLAAGVSAPVTSNHTFDGASGTAWGNGATNSGAGPAINLDCSSCHDPHGNGNYRILKPRPKDSGATGNVNVTDENLKHYTVADASNKYYGEAYPGDVSVEISNWCAQCHTRYLANGDAGGTSSGDDIFMYRHVSNGESQVNCLTCHVAHGTSASMGAQSGAVQWPDGTMVASGDARSSLLRLDNRGVCYQCHYQGPGPTP